MTEWYKARKRGERELTLNLKAPNLVLLDLTKKNLGWQLTPAGVVEGLEEDGLAEQEGIQVGSKITAIGGYGVASRIEVFMWSIPITSQTLPPRFHLLLHAHLFASSSHTLTRTRMARAIKHVPFCKLNVIMTPPLTLPVAQGRD